MPRLKTLRYDSPQYPKVLHERGITFHDLGSPTSPSNYDSIKEAICATRAHDMGRDNAEEAWNVLVGSEAEVEVLGVIAYDILTYRKMRQPKQDLWAKLNAQWEGTFPLATLGEQAQYYIAAPDPDLAIGYNEDNLKGVLKARMFLHDQCTPLKSDKQLLFPVVTVEVKGAASDEHAQRQNMHNSAVMLRNLLTLREKAGMDASELSTKFDGIAHVITISFTKSEIVICCCWSSVTDDGLLEYNSKPVATMSRNEGSKAFHTMTGRILNAVDWATKTNQRWIREDLAALEPRVGTIQPLMPNGSIVGSEVTSQ
tara:strand:+ start:995 stop:1933 length:939 start_codon:yes stop_codon:yes gene_type:complete